MPTNDDHRATNLANWNERVPIHTGESSSYQISAYVEDPQRLSTVVQFDRDRLGDLKGKRVVHLQCHIGTDTLSLARLGADVTGVDFSPAAVEAARDLFSRCHTDGRFVEADLYDAAAAVGGDTFDLVYTGVGAIHWLPDIAGWAQVVADLLEPGGRLVVRDGHPAYFTLDITRDDDLLTPMLSYFSNEPLVWNSEAGTYADPDSKLTNNTTVEWVHSISDILNGLIAAGMRIDRFDEYETLDWKGLDHMVPVELDQWALPDHQAGYIPLAFSVEATKVAD